MYSKKPKLKLQHPVYSLPITIYLHWLIFAIAFLFTTINLHSQSTTNFENYKVIHYGVEDGLSQGTAYSILKDSRGFMWFTSYEGLNRFDGHQFKVYLESPRDSNSLKGSQSFGLVEDPYGNIWTGTNVCLNRYLRQSDQFDFVFAQNKAGTYLPSSINYPFFADSTEVWYINDKEGILAYDFIKNQKRIISADFFYRQSSFITNSTVRTRDGLIWYRDKIGLVLIDPYTGKHSWYFSGKENNSLGEALRIVCFYQDADDIIWLGYPNGIIRFDYQSAQYKKIALDKYISTPITDIGKDQQGIYWLGSQGNGLLRYHESLGVIEQFQAKGSTMQRLASNAITTVYIDNQNLIWTNTDPEGIDIFIPNLKPFKKYSSNFFDPDIFATNGIRAFLETTNGNIWLGTQENGIVIFDPITDKVIHHIIPEENGFLSNSAPCFMQDSQSRIWVGTPDGLYLTENEGKHFQKIVNYKRSHNIVSSNFISDLLELPNETILFTTEKGLYFIPPNQSQVQSIDTLQNIFTGRLHLANNGYLLIAEKHNGFYVLKISDWFSSQISKKINPPFIKHFLSQFNIKHFYHSEKDNILWLATISGLVKIKYQKDWSKLEVLKQYTHDDGLPSNSIYSILADKKGKFWLSTNRGISSFDPVTETFTNYSIEDGLQGFEFNSNSFLKTSKGEFYFGGTNGFNRFHPNFKKNNITPTLQIIELKVNDKLYDKENYIGEQESIFLSHGENTFSFQFSAVDYQSNRKNQYKTILENYDNNWTELGNNNNIRYTKINHGDYIFKVSAANNDGLWNKQVKSLHIHIAPPWWKTRWAYLFYIISIPSIIYSFYRFQLSKKLAIQESKQLKEIDRLKTSLYTNITHEFRTPLTVILGMVDTLKSNFSNNRLTEVARPLEIIHRNGKKLLQLVNEMLDLAKLETGNLVLELIQSNVIPYIKYLCESFQSLAQEKQINLVVYSEVEVLLMDFDSKKLATIISNLLSNAIKFSTPHGEVIVHFNQIQQKEKAFFFIKIKDNGIGISKTELTNIFNRFYQIDNSATRQGEGTGVGLALTKELVLLMQGTIDVKSTLGKGSEFTILLPITRKASMLNHSIPQTRPAITSSSLKSNPEIFDKKQSLPIALIIEDNIDLVYYLNLCLEGKYQTLHAKNGAIGIEMAFEKIPDIIICDVMMPVKDGYEVCATLKEDERTDHIPIIMLTAKVSQQDRLKGLSLGADAYLTKPFKKVELFTRLDQLILLRKKIMRKLEKNPFSQFLNQRTQNPETKFLQKIMKHILEDIDNDHLGASYLAHKLHLSESQIYRKLKSISGKSPAIFIRTVRLQKAKELLQSSDKNISEIAYELGFKDPSWFARVFKEEFGFTPSEARAK